MGTLFIAPALILFFILFRNISLVLYFLVYNTVHLHLRLVLTFVYNTVQQYIT